MLHYIYMYILSTKFMNIIRSMSRQLTNTYAFLSTTIFWNKTNATTSKPHRIHGIFSYIYHQNQHAIAPWIPWDQCHPGNPFEVMAQYIWSRAIGLPIERPKSVPCRLSENFSVTSIRPPRWYMRFVNLWKGRDIFGKSCLEVVHEI